ncbi:MAG: hypothetical protein EU549_03105 [Promethearchaeota archaeon]|nr:MAG: hypothetical protein EU549_03105 [Candidatus Lokiarchaeota archaeon]
MKPEQAAVLGALENKFHRPIPIVHHIYLKTLSIRINKCGHLSYTVDRGNSSKSFNNSEPI